MDRRINFIRLSCVLVLSLAVPVGASESTTASGEPTFRAKQLLREALVNPTMRAALLSGSTEAKKALKTAGISVPTGDLIVVTRPLIGSVLILEPLVNAEVSAHRNSPPTTDSPSAILARKLQIDSKLRKSLKQNWKKVFSKFKIPVPINAELLIVDRPPEGAVFVLDAAQPIAASPVSEGSAAAQCRTCPPPDLPPHGPIHPSGTISPEVVSTLVKLDFKRWNQNPLGANCGATNRVPFRVPVGYRYVSTTLGQNDCLAHGSGLPDGSTIITTQWNSTAAGVSTITKSPDYQNRGPGVKEIEFNWQFAHWGKAEFKMCINVVGNQPVSTVNVFDHMNMDDGFKAYKINTPYCIDSAVGGVECNSQECSAKLESLDISKCENASFFWFICKDTNGHSINY